MPGQRFTLAIRPPGCQWAHREYNNPYNNYGWAMEKVGNHIFALTMDYSTLSLSERTGEPERSLRMG